jgi:hypothetical protein
MKIILGTRKNVKQKDNKNVNIITLLLIVYLHSRKRRTVL